LDLHDEFDDFDWPPCAETVADMRRLKVAAGQFGILDCEVDLLLYSGYDSDEIEMLLNYPLELRRAINEIVLEEAFYEVK
jgi:hypothetical protein